MGEPDSEGVVQIMIGEPADTDTNTNRYSNCHADSYSKCDTNGNSHCNGNPHP